MATKNVAIRGINGLPLADIQARAEIEKMKTNIQPIRESVFKGKTASFYGDSLTEVNSQYTKGYHKWVQELLMLASYKNYGRSGNTISDCVNKVTTVNDTSDIIFVMIGVNDEAYSTPLGTSTDTTVGTVYGGYDALCKKLREKYPTKLVVFITPHQTHYSNKSGNTNCKIQHAMKEVAERYAIPVYDNFALSGICKENLDYWTNDKCHWNDKAHEMVGRNLSKFMLNNFDYLTTQ